jgi:hypothetical protein
MGSPRERRRDPGRFPYALHAENIRSPILYVSMNYLSWYFPARLRQRTDDSLGVFRVSHGFISIYAMRRYSFPKC